MQCSSGFSPGGQSPPLPPGNATGLRLGYSIIGYLFIKPKLHLFDLLWICCTTNRSPTTNPSPQQIHNKSKQWSLDSICCRFVVASQPIRELGHGRRGEGKGRGGEGRVHPITKSWLRHCIIQHIRLHISLS